jgi:SAM-dependent methyltransferase
MSPSFPMQALACPTCRHALEGESEALHCAGCGERFGAARGVPDLVSASSRRERMTDGGDPAWRRWREAMRGLDAWRERQIGRATRTDGADDGDVRALLTRAGVRGLVIDVGAKDGARAVVLPDGCDYLGVDPFAEPSPGGRFALVRGLAESLPVRDRAADSVLCFAALDYFSDGGVALDEMARVLKAGGALAIIVSVVTPTVARARGAHSMRNRVVSALRAVREVGVRPAAELLGVAVTVKERPHTHYYTREQVMALVEARFDVASVEEKEQPASCVMFIAARKRSNRKLEVFRAGR